MEGPGLYLDLGAYRPMQWSNTWVLDKCLGWKGVCVEADPSQAEPFRTERSCTVVAKAVALKSGEGSLVGSDWGGMAADGYFGQGAMARITLATLLEILVEAGLLQSERESGENPLVVDFLSLDVEMNEMRALVSFPWDRVVIRSIVVENILGSRDVEEFLILKGYVKVGSLEFDDFYCLLEGPKLWWPESKGAGSQGPLTAALKRDKGFAQYSTQELYEGGWAGVLKYVEDNADYPP